MMHNSIKVIGVTKTYPQTRETVLNNLSLEINPGELFGLIGPDGAGKTTLMRILTTLLLPDQGRVEVGGCDVVRDYYLIRKMVGYMPGRFSLYQDLTVIENLRFFAAVVQTTVEKNYHLIKDIFIQLEPFRNRPAGKLSGGMKQKLALCCALIHEPSILLLDEPTTGVDPVSRVEFWDMLDRLQEKGITIFVSTPYMDEAARCERIVLIQKGTILAMNHYQQLIDGFGKTLFQVKSSQMISLLNDLRHLPFVQKVYPSGEFHHLVLNEDSLGPVVLKYLEDLGHHHGLYFQKKEPTIEDVFIQLMDNAA